MVVVHDFHAMPELPIDVAKMLRQPQLAVAST